MPTDSPVDMYCCVYRRRDDDMISLASMMSISNLSTIGFLEDEEEDYSYWSVRTPLACAQCASKFSGSIFPPNLRETIPMPAYSVHEPYKWQIHLALTTRGGSSSIVP